MSLTGVLSFIPVEKTAILQLKRLYILLKVLLKSQFIPERIYKRIYTAVNVLRPLWKTP